MPRMFLFTTPPSSPETGTSGAKGAAPGVVDAIRSGARASGADFGYLLTTARRESSLDPAAKAGTSSATGLFQFIEQTWLGVMKTAGPRLGLSTYADAITARTDGTFAVADPAARQAILDLRRDPRVSATLAGALTQKNGEALGSALGREPTDGDLYAAHVLGPKGASTLIASAHATPERPAALDLPEAAAANRALFYDRTGRPRTAADLYASLSAGATAARAAASDLTAVGQALVGQPAVGQGGAPGGDLRTLFQTDRRGAVSPGVARLWEGRAASGDTGRPAPTYFPRSGTDVTVATIDIAAGESASATTAPAAQAATAPGRAIADPPAPPRRPADLGSSAARAETPFFPFVIRSGP